MEERLQQHTTGPQVAEVSDDHQELQRERVLEEHGPWHGRISRIHGKPWDEVQPGSTAPAHWFDSTDEGGPVGRPWERAERANRKQKEREEREWLKRMARANIPPPQRRDAHYGPVANNPEGDDEFRRDRAVWYEHVTGETLERLRLTEQWDRVDVIARRFREYTDGRSARTRDDLPARK